MPGRDEKIEAEIRRRVFERMKERERLREQQMRKESNLEALEAVFELSREEIERIDGEVRAEFESGKRRRNLFLMSVVACASISLGIALWVIKGGDRREKEMITSFPTSEVKKNLQQPSFKGTPSFPVESATSIPEQTGPILSRADAEAVLRESLLECLRDSGHYSMIVRIGQGYDAPEQGPLAALKIVYDKAVVDYYDVDNFSNTLLGKCAARAASGVRTSAFKGNYMRFALVNDDATDPLAGAAETIDRQNAKIALSAFDEEARECALRHPRYAEQGKIISFSVRFRGVDGAVIQVMPFYINESPYRTCLEQAFSQARVAPFRRLEGKVLHKLSP